MTTKAPEQTREKLLEATVQLVLERGNADFSLEAVAQRAGVSKGGLLHHFPSKDQLILGVAERQHRLFSERLEQLMAQEPEGTPGRWARAYIETSFFPDETERRLGLALPPSSVRDMEPFRSFMLEQCRILEHRSLDDGLPPAQASLIRLACDGLYTHELSSLKPVNPDVREQVRLELLGMTR